MKVKRRRCIHTVFSVYHFFLFRSYSSAAKFTRWLPSDFYQGFKQINSLTLILLGCSKHFGCIESFRQRGVQLAPHDLDAGWGYQGTKNSLLYSIQIYCSIWAQNTRGMVLVSGLVKEMFALMTTIMLRGVQSDRFLVRWVIQVDNRDISNLHPSFTGSTIWNSCEFQDRWVPTAC